jgi:hypothetical protein
MGYGEWMGYDENRQFSVCGYGVSFEDHFGGGAVQCPCGLDGSAIGDSTGMQIVRMLKARHTADEARLLFLAPVVEREGRRMPDERDGLWVAIRRFVDDVLNEGVASRYLEELRRREASGNPLLQSVAAPPTRSRRKQPRGEWKLREG